jgi:hypothetical protein
VEALSTTITSSTTSRGTRRTSSPITAASFNAGTIRTVFILLWRWRARRAFT